MSVAAKNPAAKLNAVPSKAPSNGVSPKMHPKVSAAGLSALKNQVAQAKSFVASYEKIIADLDAARGSADFWSNMVLAGQLTVGMCDGFVAVVGELTGPGGELLKEGYGQAKPFATVAGNYTAGNGLDKAALGKAALGAAGSLAKHAVGKVPGATGIGQTAFNLSTDAKVHIGNAVIDAINGDEYKVADALMAGGRKGAVAALAKGAGKVGDKSAGVQGKMDKSAFFNRMDHGRDEKLGAGEKLGKTVGVLNELFDVGQSLGGAIAQWKIEQADNKDYFDAQKKTIIAKLKQVKEKVRQLEAQIIALEGAKNVAAWKPGQQTMPGRVAQH